MAVDYVVGVAAIEVPYVSLHAERPRTVSSRVVYVGSKQFVEHMRFEGADCFAEQTGADKEEEIGHHNKENR